MHFSVASFLLLLSSPEGYQYFPNCNANRLIGDICCREADSSTPKLFQLVDDDEVVSMPGCNDSTVYLECTRVQVNMEAVTDRSINEVVLPDGTLVQRSGHCNDGESVKTNHHCVHFNNDNHTASVYMSYALENGPVAEYALV